MSDVNRARSFRQNESHSYQLATRGATPQPVSESSIRPSRFQRIIASFDEQLPNENDEDGQPIEVMKKDLQSYHIKYISLGSAIGTGLFIGSGQALAESGPLPLLVAFIFVGAALCPTIFALGEMATLCPLPGGFFEHCRRYTGEAWGAAMGWNYVFQWLVTLPLELVAASITIQVWGEPLGHRSIWIILFLFVISVINVLGVKRWGDIEAGFSIMKVVAILGFIIFAILRTLGLGFDGEALGMSFWYDPGASVNGGLGFCSVLVTAAFAYAGSEMVGLTAEEQENPRRDMPRAIKQVFFRIGVFYIFSIFLIGMIVKHNDPKLLPVSGPITAATSPFVIAIQNTKKAPGLRNLFNGVILVTILTVANAAVYGSSRVLNAMALVDLAPKYFAYVDKKGRPLRCFYLALIFGFLAFLTELTNQATVFKWFLSICGLSSIISWASICWTHIRFRKALKLHKKAVTTLPYESPMGVFGSYIGLLLNAFIIAAQFVTAVRPIHHDTMTHAQRVQHFFQNFMAFPLIIVVYFTFKYYKGTTFKDGKIVCGAGTKPVNLSHSVGFEDSWNEGDYVKYAIQNPGEVDMKERLWWLWEPLRRFVTFFDFPWRRRSEKTEVDDDREERLARRRTREARWHAEMMAERQEFELEEQRVMLHKQKMDAWQMNINEIRQREE